MPQALSEEFIRFANAEARDSSPLYHALAVGIANDADLLDVAARVPIGQPAPNLLLAAVHGLLREGSLHTLRDFYGTCVARAADPAEAFPQFRDFVFSNRQRIIKELETRKVQTNEVRRCSYLLPAFLHATKHFGRRPLALVEIGTSAGLNLLWDRYAYDYGSGTVYGDVESPVRIHSSFRGALPVALENEMPVVSHRLGVDLAPVDTTRGEDAEWLRSLVWPEQHDRRELLNQAITLRQTEALDVRTGDGFALLPDIVDELPEACVVGVFHTHVANQISPEARGRFLRMVDEIGRRRDIIHLFNNIHPTLHRTLHHHGRKLDCPVAQVDGHGRWIEWLC